ncbi:ABC transporter substrate-binding protein [Haloferax sp. DFSO52]|uniref:ABC transporter substrate-binding protein n=1 Tax=Haloferax sp. DFSO52 TaxID=3388505 RepID=UPI003A83795C
MSSPRLHRRSLLALAAAGLTSGCIRQFESAVSRDETRQLSLKIKTVPADADAAATKLARYLSTRLQQVGIDATVVPMSREELLRSVLLNHDFDMYVYRYPLQQDPDFLRPLFHSRFSPDTGWKNPFGYGDLSVDSLLERQRTETGPVRAATLEDVQRRLVENQPLTPICVPTTFRATRPERVEWPSEPPIHSVPAYLAATLADPESVPSTPAETASDAVQNQSTLTTTERTTATSPSETGLRITTTDARPTENLNPLSAPFRSDGTVIRLIYDSLGRELDGQFRPWMAESWSWLDSDSSTLAVRLRDDLTWHDGRDVTASDVEFTFEFLDDTSLGSFDQPVPSPRYRGRASLVEEVSVRSAREVYIRFDDVAETVAERSLTVPILPKHVWEAYARKTSMPVPNGGPVTEALVRNNLRPVGSGPLRVTGTSLRESVSMEPFESHFLSSDSVEEPLEPFEGGFSFDSLEFTVVPSDGAAVELLRGGTVDATANPLSPDAADVARSTSSLDVLENQSRWCYHVGYNLRRAPLTNPRFRRAVARLVDRQFLTSYLFDGDATDVVSILGTTEFAPQGDSWKTTVDSLEFAGTRGTGTLDIDRARSMFENAGYTYSSESELLVQE